jgi:hypothetical protein
MLDSLTVYRPDHGSINAALTTVRVEPMPVITGQALSRRKWQPYEREFWAADFYTGDKRLIKPRGGDRRRPQRHAAPLGDQVPEGG